MNKNQIYFPICKLTNKEMAEFAKLQVLIHKQNSLPNYLCYICRENNLHLAQAIINKLLCNEATLRCSLLTYPRNETIIHTAMKHTNHQLQLRRMWLKAILTGVRCQTYKELIL